MKLVLAPVAAPTYSRAMLRCLLAVWLTGLFAMADAATATTIKLATWNMEWLLTPATFSALKPTCTENDEQRRASQRLLPCDVAEGLERSAIDIAALRRYAEQLDADVIAIQEVDGPNAARQVFPQHEFCFTGSKALQNNGFAIRRGVPYRCGEDLNALSLGDSVRRGATIVLYPGSDHELYLLGVHLKSGCARPPLDRGPSACEKLARQIPALEGWIDTEARAGHRYAVLGDFNRDLLAERGPARNAAGRQRNIWGEISDGEPPGATLVNVAASDSFRNCAQGQNHSGFIDQILLDKLLARQLVAGSLERLTWDGRDAARLKLSDHCPVAVRLRIESPH
jgi:endonuclease/exonuclease/phosphatase family metal-dependent hydrolase